MRYYAQLMTAALSAALLLTAGLAGAQELKPQRDKASKKFGYVAGEKGQWVIEPQFDKAHKFFENAAVSSVDGRFGIIDKSGQWILEPAYDDIDDFKKNGLCRLMGKDGGSGRLYGVANTAGTVVLPLQFTAINIDKKYDVVAAKRNIALDGAGKYEDKRIQLWGLYGKDGEELVPPQFSSAPSFSNGYSLVTSARTEMKGVIDLSGQFVVPEQNLSIKRRGTKYIALTSDFVRVEYDENFNPGSSYQIPGYVLPYDTMDDDIRAVTYGKLRIGEPLHRNELKKAEITTPKSVRCSDLGIDWGTASSRFVRLEVIPETEDRQGDMTDSVSGQSYTVAARLYEADGSYVGDLSRWGWIDGVCAECVIYCTESGDQWAVMMDINNSAAPSFSSRMTNYKAVTDMTVQGVFGLGASDLKTLRSWSRSRELHRKVLLQQNVGICSYSPVEYYEPLAEPALARMAAWPLLRQEFLIGDVVSASFGRPKDDQLLVQIGDGLKMRFRDSFEDSDYSADGVEEIYWGPGNRRFIKLALIPVKTEKRKLASPDKATDIFDDMYRSGYAYRLAVNMYEEDGSFLRCLGESRSLGFAPGGNVLLYDLGIVLQMPRSRQLRGGQKVPFALPHKATLLSQLRNLSVEKPRPAEETGTAHEEGEFGPALRD